MRDRTGGIFVYKLQHFLNKNVTVLCICVLFSGLAMPIVIHAEEPTVIEPRMDYISTYTTSLNINNGVASIYGLVRAKDNVTTYVKVTLQITSYSLQVLIAPIWFAAQIPKLNQRLLQPEYIK